MKHLALIAVLVPLLMGVPGYSPPPTDAVAASPEKEGGVVVLRGMKDKYELGEAIVLDLDMSNVPAGAELKPGLLVDVVTDAAKYEVKQGALGQYFLWGAPGKYEVRCDGLWGIRNKSGDGWSDFGLVRATAKFVVGDGQVNPPPPPPSAATWLLIVEDPNNRPEYQGDLYQALRKSLPDYRLRIHSVAAMRGTTLQKYLDGRSGTAIPAVLAVNARNEVVADVPLPDVSKVPIADAVKQLEGMLK